MHIWKRGQNSADRDHVLKYFQYGLPSHQSNSAHKSPHGHRSALSSRRGGGGCRPRTCCSQNPALPISWWAATQAKEILQTVQTGISIGFLRTSLLLTAAIAAPRCAIALSTVLTHGKVIPCALIACTNYGVFSCSYGLEKKTVNALLDFQRYSFDSKRKVISSVGPGSLTIIIWEVYSEYFQSIYSEYASLIPRGWLKDNKPNNFPSFVMGRHSNWKRTWKGSNKIIFKM